MIYSPLISYLALRRCDDPGRLSFLPGRPWKNLWSPSPLVSKMMSIPGLPRGLAPELQRAMDDLLEVPSGARRSALFYLKEYPPEASNAVIRLCWLTRLG